MIKKTLSRFKHPLIREVDIDSPENTQLRFQIIREKVFLSRLYDDWYRLIATQIPQTLEGSILELGSGAGHLKKFIPDLITSELTSLFRMPVSI